MAYYLGANLPIQWGGPITSPSELASVIQGEAQSPTGQFGVASVIYNRLNSPGFGSGITGVVTPSQFNGYQPVVSDNAQSLANDLWNGNPPSGGTTGNALFYSATRSPLYATGQATQITAGGTDVGGNLLSDRLGAPSSNFVAPQFGAQSTTNTSGDISAQPYLSTVDYGTPQENYELGAVEGDTNATNIFGTPQSNLYANYDVADESDPTQSDASNYTIGVGDPNNEPQFTAGQPTTADQTTNSGSTNEETFTDAAGNSISYDTGNPPLNTDQTSTVVAPNPATSSTSATPNAQTIPAAINAQTTAAAQDTTTANKQAASDTAASTSTSIGELASAELTLQDFLIRAALIAAGLLLIGFGLYMIAPRSVQRVADKSIKAIPTP